MECFPEDQGEDQEHCQQRVLRSHVEYQVDWRGHLREEWEDEIPRVGIREYHHSLGEGVGRMG